jgi:amidase
MRRDPGRLRIGYTSASPIGTEVHPEAVRAVEHAAKLLASLGHEVEEAAPDIDGAALAQSYLHMYFGQIPAAVTRARALGARPDDIELMNRVLVTLGSATSATQLTTQLNRWNEFSRALGDFHQRYDLLLTPTLAAPPVRHGTGDPSGAEKRLLGFLHGTGLLGVLARLGLLDKTVEKIATDNLRYVPFTQLSNLTGTPSMSVPLHWTAEGLPLGVQFVGPFGSEDRLLQLARQLEEAQPWFHRLPKFTEDSMR